MSAETGHSGLAGLIDSALDGLSTRRPLFHSEADFQLALAWQIQLLEPSAGIRLERRILNDPVVAVDVLVDLDHTIFAIELKYLKSHLEVDLDDEPFRLASGAPDVERYDFLRDLSRLERITSNGLAAAGCALLLTNASGFWREGSGRATGFDAFRLHEGRRLEGALEWGPTAGPGTQKGREAPIQLRGTYPCHWRPYSTPAPSRPNGELRFLAIIVGEKAGSP